MVRAATKHCFSRVILVQPKLIRLALEVLEGWRVRLVLVGLSLGMEVEEAVVRLVGRLYRYTLHTVAVVVVTGW